MRALALAAVLAVAGGCGTATAGADGGADGLLDSAPTDQLPAGQWDANCSFSRSCQTPPAPTHGTFMVYDHYLDYSVNCYPQHVFVDPDGVTVFAGIRFLRADLDGTLLHAETLTWSFQDAAQGADTYGVVLHNTSSENFEERRFCVFTRDGAPDISTCPLVEGSYRAWPVWDGTVYWLSSRIDESTMYVKTYDESGAELSNTRYADWTSDRQALGQLALLGDKVVMPTPGGARDRPGCPPYWLDELPRSLDTEALKSWPLSPEDVGSDGMGALLAQSPRRIALLYGGVCILPATWVPSCQDVTTPCSSFTCSYDWPGYRVSLLTMVDADGLPLEPYPRCLPAVRHLISSVIWDGAQFVYLTMAGLYDVEVGTFDEDGNPLASGARPTLLSRQGAELLGAHLAAVGPNDYIVVYALQSSGANYIARFSLVPL